MSDKGPIALGLAAFLILAAYPVWSGLAAPGDGAKPELEPARDASGCVEDASEMAARHQPLLNEWRTAVVRDGERFYTSSTGQTWEMSLTDTCLGCHTNAETFCQTCHEYSGVEPTCWSCHVERGGGG